jgi:hypothetical protein
VKEGGVEKSDGEEKRAKVPCFKEVGRATAQAYSKCSKFGVKEQKITSVLRESVLFGLCLELQLGEEGKGKNFGRGLWLCGRFVG